LNADAETQAESGIEESLAPDMSDRVAPFDLVQLRMPHKGTSITGADVWPR